MSFIRRIFRPDSFLARKSKHILVFFNGFLLALLLFFYTEKQYEENLFASMAAYMQDSFTSITSSRISGNEDSLLIESMHLVHRLGERRLPLFGQYPVKGIKTEYIQPVSSDLMTAQGACGSHSYVLGRLLQEMNIDVRFPQMTVEGQPAGHILVEAKTSYGWVALDPLSNAFFRKPDGKLAGFNDVKDNWNYYQDQLPAGYNMAYRYEGVRYTNWERVPLVMPLIKNVMYWTMGKEKTDSYSLRNLVLRKFNVLFNFTLAIYLLVLLFSINLLIKARRKAANASKAVSPNSSDAALPVQPAP